MCVYAISLCNYSQKDPQKTLFLVHLSLGVPVALAALMVKVVKAVKVVRTVEIAEAVEMAVTSVIQRVAEVLAVAVEIMVVNAVLVAANHAAKF